MRTHNMFELKVNLNQHPTVRSANSETQQLSLRRTELRSLGKGVNLLLTLGRFYPRAVKRGELEASLSA